MAIARLSLALPSTLRRAVESWEASSPVETLVGAHASNSEWLDRALQLALFCRSSLVAFDRPRWMRKDVAGTPGFEGPGHPPDQLPHAHPCRRLR